VSGPDNEADGFFSAALLEDKLELLFDDRFSPLLAFAFLAEFESKFLIKMACWAETRKSPEIDSAILLLSTKSDGLLKQCASDAPSLILRGYDEPSQVSALAFVMDPIDGEGAYDFFFDPCHPKPITGLVKTPQKLRELNSYLRFEEKVEAPMLVIIHAVELSDSANRTRDITGQSHMARGH
jgi:hypothetical protein